jgi:hypothetical protein
MCWHIAGRIKPEGVSPPGLAWDDTTYETLAVARDLKTGTFIVRQNRPKQLNARNEQMYYEIEAGAASLPRPSFLPSRPPVLPSFLPSSFTHPRIPAHACSPFPCHIRHFSHIRFNPQAFAEAERDETVNAVLLTGTGRYFCSGADTLGGAAQVLDTDSAAVQKLKRRPQSPDNPSTWPACTFVDAFINLSKPLIAVVNGPAVGEGVSCLLHCDLCYSVENATFWWVAMPPACALFV